MSGAISGSHLLQPEATAAVVIGAHDWSEAGLGRAPSFLRSAKGLAHYLIDSAGLGLDPTLVLDLFDDPASAGEQLARIRDTFDVLLRERSDEGRPVADLLVYYVGHGHTDDQNHLSLLVRRSRRGMEAETGIKAPDLARVLKIAAPQQRRMIVLDCCFSEAAARDFVGQGAALDQAVAATAMKDLEDDQPRRGTLLLCSSPVGEVSMGAPNAARTLFTGAVLEVLTKGAEGRASVLSFADLRDAAYEQMLDKFGANAPRPVLHQVNAAHGDLTRTPAFPNRSEAKEARHAKEEKRQAKAEQARRAEAEERQAKAEQARRAEMEKRRAEAEEQRKAEEAARLAEEQRKAEEAVKVRVPPAAPISDWAAQRGEDTTGRFADISVNGITQRLRWIPPGSFKMASPPGEWGRFDDEGPQRDVTLASGFWLFDTPCTQALWQAVMGNNPSISKGPDRPVETVFFEDVSKFLMRINTLVPSLKLELPSEARWEYAARAGTTAATYNGDLAEDGATQRRVLNPIVWWSGNSNSETHPVGQKLPNAWGLKDMLGNVWEWCADNWHDNYTGAPMDGSAWLDPAGGAASRVIRGGSWGVLARLVRAAYRNHDVPRGRGNDFGFRCARVQSASGGR